jgi:hypothetical protein
VVRDPKGKPDALFFQRAVRLRVFYAIKLLPLLQNPVGRLLMYGFFFLQRVFANTELGDEILVIARKTL